MNKGEQMSSKTLEWGLFVLPQFTQDDRTGLWRRLHFRPTTLCNTIHLTNIECVQVRWFYHLVSKIEIFIKKKKKLQRASEYNIKCQYQQYINLILSCGFTSHHVYPAEGNTHSCEWKVKSRGKSNIRPHHSPIWQKDIQILNNKKLDK